jgi:hypothetical protein
LEKKGVKRISTTPKKSRIILLVYSKKRAVKETSSKRGISVAGRI